VAKFNSVVEFEWLEQAVREHLNKTATRVMGVIKPLKLVVTDFPDDRVDELDAINNPEDESYGKRKVPFTKTLYIEQSDFMEDAPRKYFRLTVGKEVRLRYAYLVTCTDVVKDSEGNVVEVHCTHDPDSRGGNAPDGRKVKGTIHWVSADKAIDVEVRLYDRLFSAENPDQVEEGQDWKDNLNPASLEIVTAKLEPSVLGATAGDRFQFERTGYFCVDSDSTSDKIVFNRTVGLKDSWAKMQQKKNS
jgi:glutaminyl-tRNA synthetase